MSESRKIRPGIPMTEDAVKEWEKAFTNIMRLKQQELPL